MSGEELVSHTVFVWFISILTAGVGAYYFVVRSIQFVRRRDASTPEAKDMRFGCLIGVVIGAVGAIGVLKYHLS